MFVSSGVLSWGLSYVAKSQETQMSKEYDGKMTRKIEFTILVLVGHFHVYQLIGS